MSLAIRLLEAIAQDIDYNGLTQNQIKLESEKHFFRLATSIKKEFAERSKIDTYDAVQWILGKVPNLSPHTDSIKAIANAVKNNFIEFPY